MLSNYSSVVVYFRSPILYQCFLFCSAISVKETFSFRCVVWRHILEIRVVTNSRYMYKEKRQRRRERECKCSSAGVGCRPRWWLPWRVSGQRMGGSKQYNIYISLTLSLPPCFSHDLLQIQLGTRSTSVCGAWNGEGEAEREIVECEWERGIKVRVCVWDRETERSVYEREGW